ncbi:MAG: SurA N-terminal domain-containing protein [Desulfobacteraceae bacterium]|nr:SurA N-terminal domain-containing protein [Desulfobacteraceae bacterium]
MLDLIRRNANSWLLKFILGAIALVFVFWGIGNFRSHRTETVASVNGEKISVESYRRAYGEAIEHYKQMFKGRIPEGLLEKLNVKQQVIGGLIQQALVRQAANNMGIRISDEELQKVILGIPAFQHNGVFNKTMYERMLRSQRLLPITFENQLRERMLTERVVGLLSAGLAVPEDEARDYYMYENQQINLAYILFNSNACTGDVKPTAQDISAWYDAHKDAYRTEPQISLGYLFFDRNSLANGIKISDEEAKNYYRDHISDYEKKEERRASHILLKVPADASEAQIEEVKKKAEGIMDRIKKGEDFKALAREFSEDPASAKQGGDLGFFTRGKMAKPFDDAVFSMKVGEVKGPVLTQFGWHIIRLDDIRPASTTPFDEVKDAIMAKLKNEKARRLAWDDANSAYNEIMELGSLAEYTKRHGLKLETTGLFTEKTAPQGMGLAPDIIKTLFSLGQGELSSILQTPKGALIAQVIDKKAPYVRPLEEVKDMVKDAVIADKARKICKAKAVKALQIARQKGIEEAARDAGLNVSETGFFKHSDMTANGKLPFPVAKAGFSLYPGKVFPDDVVSSGNDFYVLSFKGMKDADPNGFAAQKDALVKRLLSQKQRAVLESWISDLKSRAKIKINDVPGL